MPEREQTRLRERDRAAENQHPYEVFFDAFKERRAQAENGQIVIKGKDLPWQQSRQGRSKYFLHLRAEDRAMQDWMLFQKDIMTESGAHTHQGGLVIYVTRGAGYSVFDGVEHQHFNYDDNQSSQWVAFIYIPFLFQTGSMLAQVKEQSNWREAAAQEQDGALDPIAEVTAVIGARAKAGE